MSLTNASPEDAARSAKRASYALAALPIAARDAALDAVHAALEASRDAILAANARDVELLAAAARGPNANPADLALLSRLDLAAPGKWDDMLRGVLDVRRLPDPLGVVSTRTRLDDGLVLERLSCPIGVLLVIFEARPEVIVNIASLAIKSGNAVILKGGKESTQSFVAIANAIANALAASDVPPAAVQLVTTRDAIAPLLAQDRHIDLVVPRGSAALVRHVRATTRIPVLGHADGLCSIYLTASADAALAAAAVLDAKTSYPAACNSVETLLVEGTALRGPVFAAVVAALVGAGVELRCDPTSKEAALAVLGDDNDDDDTKTRGRVVDAVDEDFDTEFLAPTLAVRAVGSLDEAVDHIHAHGSGHTEAVLTADRDTAESFMARVDAAGVFWNASTRMADGARYGLGAEVGVSTAKVHARGPVGLEGLTIYKYKLRGGYQVSAAYGEGPGKKAFKHEKLPL